MDFVGGIGTPEYIEWCRTAEPTSIEEECTRLVNEQYDYVANVYERKTGQKYVDPNAKF